MALDQSLIVHPVELVACEDQLVVILASGKTMEVLPNRIRCSLEPVQIGHCLLGGQNFNVSLGKRIETKRCSDVMVQRRRIELRKNEQFFQSGVKAIADRDI